MRILQSSGFHLLDPCFTATFAPSFAGDQGIYCLGSGLLPENQHGKKRKDQQPYYPSKELLINDRKRLSHNHEPP
jgi:hypothetical protein